MTTTDTMPTLAIRTDGQTEDWSDPADAEYFAHGEANDSLDISDDGTVVTVVGHDADDRRVELEYRLSKVMAELAIFDADDADVTVRTAPTKTEWATVYPLNEFENDDWTIETDDEFGVDVATRPVETSAGLMRAREFLAPDALAVDGDSAEFPQDALALWNRADDIDISEDYICVTGLDASNDPIPKPYESYYVLVRGTIDGADEPFFVHSRADE